MTDKKSLPEKDGVPIACSNCLHLDAGCPHDLFNPPPYPCPDFSPYRPRVVTPRKATSSPTRLKASRRYYARNKDKIKARYKATRKKRLAYQKMYRELNREAIRLKDREYRRAKRNKEKSDESE